MVNAQSGVALRRVSSLLWLGAASGLTDDQLLERFVSGRGEAAEFAFEALVERHGPMVLGVCRRILSDPHDAEDAFQATFLVLVRRAGSVRVDGSLGRWLHGVSHRVAVRARAARRRRREGTSATDPAAPPVRDAERLDLRAVLDEEIGRLPEKYRAPVILFHLEGLSHEATARALGWPLGTVQGRLARARERLRARLTRRGLAPSAVVLAPSSARASLPVPLVRCTVRAAIRVSAGKAAWAGLGPACAMVLREGMAGSMALTRLKVAPSLLLIGIVGAGASLPASRATDEDRPDRGQAVVQVVGKPAGLKVEQELDSDRVTKGKSVRIRISVTNPGAVTARDVLVRVRLDPGLQADLSSEGDGTFLKLPVGEVGPGERVKLDPLVVWAIGEGQQTCRVEAVGQGVAATARSVRTITVTDPAAVAIADLELQIEKSRRVVAVGQTTMFKVTVTNRGSRDATRLLISGRHTGNLTVTRTSGTEAAASRDPTRPSEFAFSPIDRLASGMSITLGIEVRARKPGAASCTVSLMHDELEEPQEDIAAFKIVRALP